MSGSAILSRQDYLAMIPSWWEVPGVGHGAVSYDADMAALNDLGERLGEMPTWSGKVRSAMPKWGMEMCAHRWLQGIEELIESTAHEQDLTTGAGHCGDLPANVQAVMRARATGIGRWLAGESARTDGERDIYRRLGTLDELKTPTARCLQALIEARLWRDWSTEDLKLAVASWREKAENDPLLTQLLAEYTLVDSLDNACGFMLIQRLDWALDLIGGDGSHAQDRVGNCNAQLRFLWQHDVERYAATRGYLWGMWAYLAGHSLAWLQQHKPDCAPSSKYALNALSSPTEHLPLRRWLVASLLKTTLIWCQRALERSAKVAVPDWAGDLPELTL